MSEKYTTLKSLSLESDSRYPFSPDKIRILRRNEDGFTVLQIRLASNSDKVIVNAVIDILCLPSGKVIKKVYSDFSAAKGEFFGTKVPVEAGKETVDSIEISVAEAVFEDGTVWTAEHFETETEKSVPEESVTENIVSREVFNGTETDVGETAAVFKDEVFPKSEPEQNISKVLVTEKIPLLKKIGKNKLIAGACGAAAVVIIIIAAALGGRSDEREIVSETLPDVTQISMTETTLATTSLTEATTMETAKEVTQKEEDYVTIRGKKYSLSMTSLNLSYIDLGYADLIEVSKMVNLTTLNLSNCKISDISPLSSLTKLKELNLSDNQISDVRPLSTLSNLKTLNLKNNKIIDSSAVESMGIKNLYLDGNLNDIDIPEKYTTDSKTFDFDGGYINCTEYNYYSSDGWEKRIGFSADVNINDYPYAGTAITKAISNIVPPPSEYDLENSLSDPDPDALQTFMTGEECNQISNVYAEGDAMFITIRYYWSTGGYGVGSHYGYSYSYIFDMRTGEEISVKDIFQDFESFKQDAVYLADQYIKENVPYEVYSIENYYEKLLNSTWYDNHSWTIDGDVFTVDFGPLFEETFYWAFTNIEVPIKVTSDSDGTSGDSYDSYYDVYQYGYVNIDSDTLNVREEPSTGAKKIGSLADGAEVYIYSYTDGWYYIYYEKNELYGYVSSEFINLY